MDNERRIAPLDESSLRQILVGWGSGLMCSTLGFLIGGIFVPYLGLFAGAAIALRGHFPGIFAKHVDAQLIKGTPYRREESLKSWIIVGFACLLLAGIVSSIHRRVAPEKPDLTRTILDEVRKLREQQQGKQITGAPVATVAAAPQGYPIASPRSRPLATQSRGIREQGLALSSDILDFLSVRRKSYPRKTPTPQLMRETLPLFLSKFESRITDAKDAFAGQCLSSNTFNLMGDAVKTINANGDIDGIIQLLSESIRSMSYLVGPDTLYKDLSNAEIARAATEEADTMDRKVANEYKNEITVFGLLSKESPEKLSALKNQNRRIFARDFKVCCLSQIIALRSEIIKRIGPSTCDVDEMRSFYSSPNVGFAAMDENTAAFSVMDISLYSRYFRSLSVRLTEKLKK